eukprot:TRINITY_DN3832_c0_g1_i1.p1 TRINITY_DN3832_c0_g1~~TRINITY_DN3832_c0_g1_i1.p1  ORF type:complete len:236 (-),score=34.44 TRINITY_DN3832_c0_g1_i1:23-730(-)
MELYTNRKKCSCAVLRCNGDILVDHQLLDGTFILPSLENGKEKERFTALKVLRGLGFEDRAVLFDKTFKHEMEDNSGKTFVMLGHLQASSEQNPKLNGGAKWVPFTEKLQLENRLTSVLLPNVHSAEVFSPDKIDWNMDVRKFVVHCKKNPYDVYIGRRNLAIKDSDFKWGNPFKLEDVGDLVARAAVVEQHKQWILSQPRIIADIRRELRGKVLACWCAPLQCHGDALARIANS